MGDAVVLHDDAAAIDAILTIVARSADPHPVVLIDGPSGAGKSTLADLLLAAWPRRGAEPQLLRMDALVPGWDGLAVSSTIVEAVLREHRAGRPASWRAWDWSADRAGAESVVAPDRALVVEGSGSVTAASAAVATVVVWVDLRDERERRRRAIDRDGDTYAPHWDRWAAQELAHARDHRPRERATVILDRTEPVQ